MSSKKIVLLFGGESSEHDVSIASARNVFSAIDKETYSVLLVYITRQGKWYEVDGFESITRLEATSEIMPQLGSKLFVTKSGNKQFSPDVIFPILHGEHGEDGTIQGLAKLLHIPIIGAGIDASAIAIDKDVCKRIVSQAGIPVVPYRTYHKGGPLPDINELSQELGDVLFVKPARLGSSVGVSKVRNQEELEKAIAQAVSFDAKLLIEKSITGRELEIGILGNDNDFSVSNIGEIQPDQEFYSYESKYDPEGVTKIIIPAKIPAEIKGQIQTLARLAYRAIEGSGLSRIDFFLSDDGALYLNEVNTLPGFTDISMYPKLWEYEGIEYSELIDKLIEFAIKKEGVR